MHHARHLRLIALLLAATAFSTPFVGLPAAAPKRIGTLGGPPDGFCSVGACGYGRDGIPTPYTGRGISGFKIDPDPKTGAAAAFPAGNVSLLSWLTSGELTGNATQANDVWGYTSPRGREYAIIGFRTGTSFVDITRPTRPRIVQFVPGVRSSWRDIAVYRDFAYTVNEGGGGLQVIDLTGIDQGRVVVAPSVTSFGLQTAHNIYVNRDSGYAYLLGSNLARGGLLAANLSDPARPSIETVAWNATHVHDVQVVTYTEGKYRGREIAFAFTGPMGLLIVDVTDKSAPRTLSHFVYANATYAHSGWLGPDRKFLYINDELDEYLNTKVERMTTYVVKVTDLENPRLSRRFVWDTPAIDHNSMVQGDKLYLSAYRSGLQVLDLSNPRQLRVHGWFDTYPEDDATTFSGAWGVFAGFASGTVIVSDIERGLFVLRPR